MKKRIFYLLTVLLAGTMFSCSPKAEDKAKEKVKKAPDNAFSDYVETGTNTLDQAKDLNKELKDKIKKDEEMMLGED